MCGPMLCGAGCPMLISTYGMPMWTKKKQLQVHARALGRKFSALNPV